MTRFTLFLRTPFTERQANLTVQLAGLVFFGFLVVLSLVFYKERMLAFDSANYCLEIEQWEHFCLPHGRWSSVFTQFFPLLAVRSGASLKTFLLIYSASFPLLGYLLFLVCTLLFRNNRAGLFMMLAMSLGFRWMYYYAISELLTGMAFAVLLYAVLASLKPDDHLRRKTGLSLLALFLVYTISYFHQLALFSALFVLLFELVAEKRWRDKWLWSIFLVTVIWSYVRIRFFSVQDYTEGKILPAQTYFGQLPHVFELDSWKYFKLYLLVYAKWMLYAGILANVLLLLRRHWLTLLLFNGFSAAYVLLVVLTYYKGESGLMIETYLPPLGLYTALVLLWLLYREGRNKTALLLTGWLLFVSCRSILLSSEIQLRRTGYFARLAEYGRKLPNKKYLLDERNVPVEILRVPWALPFETVLYSSIVSPDSTVTFAYAAPVSRYDSLLSRKDLFIGAGWDIDWAFHNDERLKLPREVYLKVNTSQADTSFDPAVFNAQNLRLSVVSGDAEIPYHESGYVQVRISNSSGRKLHSIPEGSAPVYLSYRILDRQGKEIVHDRIRTTLDVDVYTTYVQAVKVGSPPDAGDYILEIGFISGDGDWWESRCRTPLHVPGKSIWRWL